MTISRGRLKRGQALGYMQQGRTLFHLEQLQNLDPMKPPAPVTTTRLSFEFDVEALPQQSHELAMFAPVSASADMSPC